MICTRKSGRKTTLNREGRYRLSDLSGTENLYPGRRRRREQTTHFGRKNALVVRLEQQAARLAHHRSRPVVRAARRTLFHASLGRSAQIGEQSGYFVRVRHRAPSKSAAKTKRERGTALTVSQRAGITYVFENKTLFRQTKRKILTHRRQLVNSQYHEVRTIYELRYYIPILFANRKFSNNNSDFEEGAKRSYHDKYKCV